MSTHCFCRCAYIFRLGVRTSGSTTEADSQSLGRAYTASFSSAAVYHKEFLFIREHLERYGCKGTISKRKV